MARLLARESGDDRHGRTQEVDRGDAPAIELATNLTAQEVDYLLEHESLSEKDTPQSAKKHLLATYSHTIFKPVVPVKELWEKVLNIGATQHYAIVDGDYRAELRDFAEMMGFEFYDIR